MTNGRNSDANPPRGTPHPYSALLKAPTLWPTDRLRDLGAFTRTQRRLAAFDFTALTEAQRAISQATVVSIPSIVAAEDAISKNFAHSFDFSGLTAAYRNSIDASTLEIARSAQKQWAASLSGAINFSALHDAIDSSRALIAVVAADGLIAKMHEQQADVLDRIRESLAFKLPKIDFPQWRDVVRRWIPGNLHEVHELDIVATVALDEGIPLSWIPRPEIVLALIKAEGPESRLRILHERRADIIDDCETGLASITHEWSVQCRNAIRALRFDLDGPAQSHASNIVDSIILELHGKGGRDQAKERAQGDFEDLPLQLAAENLTLRPLLRAFTIWWPTSDTAPPKYFARHPTAHAVGHVGVFTPWSSLIAVMLATSLTMQYATSQPTDADIDHATPH